MNTEPPRLFPELWDYVIDNFRDDRHTLKACALTAHAWVAAARLRLFHTIVLRDFSRCVHFMKHTEAFPAIPASSPCFFRSRGIHAWMTSYFSFW
ncbi:hypothetical protein SCP_0601600 [Sparassis crispa]|uniref:F-box domain-containing protein n=1 Tax=Sparassis crispa TaxID=139825 RepID=A0A401GPQ6_9APHY|nr:hypothetical protein SCP_0601600 [Sparassis crispa]GBE84182.1 hypothetical protein SCP_0601600 [Sparassis crispa]